MRRSNYDKFPSIQVRGKDHECVQGWDAILDVLREHIDSLQQKRIVLTIECYPGVLDEEILSAIRNSMHATLLIESKNAFWASKEINSLVEKDVTDDPIFGKLTYLTLRDFFDTRKIDSLQQQIQRISEGLIIVYGTGASLIHPGDILLYADLARWEIQQRQRRNEISNLGVENQELAASLKYKQAFFVDWRVADKLKKRLINRWDFVLDTNTPGQPVMTSGNAIREGLRQTAQKPFRVVPFFDPGPWGGQWMKEVCDLDRSVENFAWCFDCVPEENSLYLGFGEYRMELPALDLVFYQPTELLGDAVHARFGTEFPIRFDFLDTMDGGNLSLQVHPLTEYIQEQFGMHYTQDESYYMLDAKDDAYVYLGLKEDIDPSAMISALGEAQQGGVPFDAERYVQAWPAKKHDHFLIPAGTVHCSGANAMVLEISATPYIFTFKLWDWGRLGLDGKSRPINIEHGQNVIQWERTTSWTEQNLVNHVQKIDSGDGWVEERTGLHEREFIETRRHWFTKKVIHHTDGGVNVLNLIQGDEALVESPNNVFEPFVVHYAETFIIPASVGSYTLCPYGKSEQAECASVKAFVRTNF